MLAGEKNARQIDDVEGGGGAREGERVQVGMELERSGEGRAVELRTAQEGTLAMLTAHHGHAKSTAAVMWIAEEEAAGCAACIITGCERLPAAAAKTKPSSRENCCVFVQGSAPRQRVKRATPNCSQA